MGAELSGWLSQVHETLASITWVNVNHISINFDVRSDNDTGASRFVEQVQGFLVQQQCSRIDGMLVDDARFKVLESFTVDLLCGPRTHAPDAESWKEIIFTKFPQLHLRRVLR